jgi:uncharacterized phiE125 gp8 family phage protein
MTYVKKSPFKLITPPLKEPVSLAEVKEYLGIQATDTVSDALIARRIVVARKWAETHTGRAFITQTREIRWDCFVGRHELPSALTVVSVKYIDADGAEQTLSASDYLLDTYSFIPHVRKAYGVSWPTSRAEENAVRIQYTAGYGPLASDVEPGIIEALLTLIGHWMNFQPQSESGITPSRIPFSVIDKLNDFKLDFL